MFLAPFDNKSSKWVNTSQHAQNVWPWVWFHVGAGKRWLLFLTKHAVISHVTTTTWCKRVNCSSFQMFPWEHFACCWITDCVSVTETESLFSFIYFPHATTISPCLCHFFPNILSETRFRTNLPFVNLFYSLHLLLLCQWPACLVPSASQRLSFSSRLHVQSPTCSSRSSSISASCTRHCWWSSSNFPLIPPPLLPRLVCIIPVALSPVNQSWIPSQAPIRLRASPTHCTPKSRRLRPMPTTPILSVRLT